MEAGRHVRVGGTNGAARAGEPEPTDGTQLVKFRSEKVDVNIEDLDDTLPTMTARLRLGARISKVEKALRQYLADDIEETDTILLYRDGEPLCDDDLSLPPSLIQFRVYPSYETPGDLTPRLTFDSPNKKCAMMFEKMRIPLLDEISTGMTVDGLRNKISNKLGLPDPNVVVISASGGMRPGPLEGGHWEIRRVQKWLCRDITIEIAPERRYVVLRGCAKQYLYHPSSSSSNKEGTTVGKVKQWLKDILLTGVHVKCSSKVDIDVSDISIMDWYLTLEDNSSLVPWASTIDFSVPARVAETFAEEQSWLAPIIYKCAICMEQKRDDEMANQVTKLCTHKPRVCIKCLEHWIPSCLQMNGWERVNCPTCAEPMEFGDIKTHAKKDIFERYYCPPSVSEF